MDEITTERIIAEEEIIKKLKEIDKIYSAYNPDGDYLDLTIIQREDVRIYSVNNDDCLVDGLKAINFTEFNDKDGNIRTLRL